LAPPGRPWPGVFICFLQQGGKRKKGRGRDRKRAHISARSSIPEESLFPVLSTRKEEGGKRGKKRGRQVCTPFFRLRYLFMTEKKKREKKKGGYE